MANLTITNTRFDYVRGKIIATVSAPYAGATSIPIKIQDVVSQEVVYNYLVAGKRDPDEGPYFAAGKSGVTTLVAGQEVP